MSIVRVGLIVPVSLLLVLVLVLALAGRDVGAQTQSLPPTGGFLEPAASSSNRPPLTADEIASLLPARGVFTFPAPYHTTVFRLTNAEDCGGVDCVMPVGYSYWRNINNHAGRDTMLVVLGLDRRRGGPGPSLFSIHKGTGETRNMGPLFPPNSAWSWNSGEGWYFSALRPHALYVYSGPRFLRYDVQARTFEPVFDVTTVFGPDRYIWQAHSSSDDRVHSASLLDRTTWAKLGCVAYQEGTGQWFYAPRIGTFDECQIDKSGRWLVIKENVDGRNGEDNRIIDLQTGEERRLLDENGAGGHSDLGFGYMVALDNFSATPGAVRLWQFGLDVSGGQPVASADGQGTLVYRMPVLGAGVGHIAHGNARPDLPPSRQRACSSNASRQLLPRVNEVVCYRLDGSLDALVVAPTLSSLDAAGGGTQDYSKLPKGNLDPTGEYFVWTTNAGSGRLDAFVVRVPVTLLDPVPTWEPVRWTDRVNVTVSGTTLQKTSGCSGCQDAGATSEQRVASGDVALSFTASESTTNRVIGLSSGNVGTQVGEIRFGVQMRSGFAEVREAGAYRKDVRFVPGDGFEIRVESGVVQYLKNGTVFYTSSSTPTYPVQVDTSLLTSGATLTNVAIKVGR